ncbi:MAG: hypothetical protein RL417_1648 [Pseudomonadota bacterium]|jgi:serine phosphatase RsbU (regulator of sigma subunit)
MDSLLVVGGCDGRLRDLFGRLGYKLIEAGADRAVPEVLRQEVVDLIVLDAAALSDPFELCEFLRTEPSARQIPLVVLSGTIEAHDAIAAAAFPLLESIPPPHSSGGVVSRIATMLRLRKIAGEEKGASATLHEMNARLRDLTEHFTREIEEAREIQQSLLPAALPKDPRFTVAAAYDPLGEVGGDWYSVHQEPSGRITLQIADVSGHGLSSAFLGSMTKLAQRAVGEESPSRLLRGMNRLMAPLLPAGKFITSAVASFDPASGALSFARAGHPPALVCRSRTGTVEELRGEGFALGFFEDGEYTEVTTTLDVGDLLFLFTDGLSESQNRDRAIYGVDGLTRALLTAPPGASAAESLRLVLDHFGAFLDGRAVKDDVTVIALKRRAE